MVELSPFLSLRLFNCRETSRDPWRREEEGEWIHLMGPSFAASNVVSKITHGWFFSFQ